MIYREAIFVQVAGFEGFLGGRPIQLFDYKKFKIILIEKILKENRKWNSYIEPVRYKSLSES